MSPSELMQAMADAGAPVAAIVIALRALEEKDAQLAARDAEAAAQRVAARDKKRRQRELSRDKSGTVPGHGGDCPDKGVSLKESPHTPKKITLPQTPPSPPLGAHGSTAPRLAKPNGFERFWEAYPRKVGKGAARKAFDRAVCRLRDQGDEGLPRMLAAIGEAKRGWDDPEFIPHPATWLNQERWDDEPAKPPDDRGRQHPMIPDEPIDYDKIRAQLLETAHG